MAACFVTGIAPTEDISELESILGEMPGVDRAKLTVITKADRTYEHDSSFLNFIHAGGPQIDSDVPASALDSTAIITGGGGTGVPGISAPPSTFGYLGSTHVIQHVGTLPIPEDEADNYNDAIEDGRCVVAYECSGIDPAPIEAAFRGGGVRKVKTFQG